jgi:hypothetical protein
MGRSYHAKSRRIAEVLGDDLALGYCHLLKGKNQHGTGDWAGASQSLAVSLRRFRVVGHCWHVTPR